MFTKFGVTNVKVTVPVVNPVVLIKSEVTVWP